VEKLETLKPELLPDRIPRERGASVAPGALGLFPTAIRVNRLPRPLTPRLRRLLRCHQPLLDPRSPRFALPRSGHRLRLNPWWVTWWLLTALQGWVLWTEAYRWRQLEAAGQRPQELQLLMMWWQLYLLYPPPSLGGSVLENILSDHYPHWRRPEFPPVPPSGGGPRGRQRRLAHRLAEARLRLPLWQLDRLGDSLHRLEAYNRKVEEFLLEEVTPWLRLLEEYDDSAQPLRVYLRAWRAILRRQQVLLLRAAGRELEQLERLLPPLRLSLLRRHRRAPKTPSENPQRELEELEEWLERRRERSAEEQRRLEGWRSWLDVHPSRLTSSDQLAVLLGKLPTESLRRGLGQEALRLAWEDKKE
jgi:hypothetical protein